MNRIFVCGDTHGGHDLKKLVDLSEKEKLDYSDYIIICGDAGIVWSYDTLEEDIKLFEDLGATILFVDGNHENYDILNKYKVESWNGGKIHKISERIFHLLRGQVFNILGKTFLTLGGADSSDKEDRQEHISWWSDESITYGDVFEAKINLEKVNNNVDYVVTHTPSTKTLSELVGILTSCGEEIPYFLQKKILPSQSSDMLDFIHKKVKFKHWFCGHLHIDENISNVSMLYNDNIVKIK